MDQPPIPETEMRNLRFLRRLVTLLMLVMIIGLVTIIGLFVIRLQPPEAARLSLPDSINLPDGAIAEAFTQAKDWYAVVTNDNRILVFDRATGELRQTVEITPTE